MDRGGTEQREQSKVGTEQGDRRAKWGQSRGRSGTEQGRSRGRAGKVWDRADKELVQKGERVSVQQG